MSEDLAFLGGVAAVPQPLAPYQAVGAAEQEAVAAVMRSGTLSGFMGAPGTGFYGGPEIQRFEQAWCSVYDCKYAISVNSATSGLIAAIGAAGIGPGDEVIVPPYSMSASVIAPLFYGAIPVFADIEADTFCLDPAEVRKNITDRTRCILAVNLFGRPSNLLALRRIADEFNLVLIEDSAQAPFAEEAGHRAGLVGDIGVFSLNYHKHIHSGEGGVCVTNSDRLARRLALIRNHGENVFAELGEDDPANLIGYNFRMTELSAAIARVQLSDIERHLQAREKVAKLLNNAVGGLSGFLAPLVPEGWRHNYYCWPLRIDEKQLGVRRETVARALAAEGMPVREGYVRPLYMLPVFQQRRAIGRDGWPFNLTNRGYEAGLCPVAERVESNELLLFLISAWNITPAVADGFIEALRKVHGNMDKLRAWEHETGGKAA